MKRNFYYNQSEKRKMEIPNNHLEQKDVVEPENGPK